MMPQRIQRQRAKGWRMPDGAVYVGRPTKWGNPFRLRTTSALARVPAALGGGTWEYEGRISADGTQHNYFHPDGRVTVCHVRYMSPAEVVETYRNLVLGDLTPSMISAGFRAVPGRHVPAMEDIRRELAGRDLACWCPWYQPCHADVLLEIANGGSDA